MHSRAKSICTLGWNNALEESFAPFRAKGFGPARVAIEDKHYYVVFTESAELTAQVPGKMLHQSARSELPKVGDWVAVKTVPGEEKATIHHVLPRRTKLSRKVPGRETQEQVLVTNVDIAFLVQALDQSFNPAVLERHLLMVHEGGVQPVIVLNKTDLCDNILEKLACVERLKKETPVIAVSARTGQAMESLTQLLTPGKTVVFIGPSGVGKSSLINHLYGEEILPTTEVRESDAKGRHTTTWRELIVLPDGALVIDTPGMREFQMWLANEGVHEAFPDIEELGTQCHFRSCSHTVEKRCAVLAAVESGTLSQERYENFLKLKRELDFLNKAAHQRKFLEQKWKKAGRPKPSGDF